METKMIKIPFEVELAKKISNGEVKGRIVTRDGRSVRIICWDRKDKDFPIVSLAGDSEYECIFHKINGEYCLYGKADKDLMLEVPEEKPKCEFKPFDKVLVRFSLDSEWCASIFSHKSEYGQYICCGTVYNQCIPYNEQTAHLLGTTNNFN